MAHRVTAANVADFVGEFRLRLPIPETIRPNGNPAGFFLGWSEPRCRSAGWRIVNRLTGVVIPSTILFWSGRFRPWMQHARFGGIARYRHRYPGGRSSSKAKGHCRAARMRAATFRRALMLVLKHQQRKVLESKNAENVENLLATRRVFMSFALSLRAFRDR